jgi:hypothetical protein
MVGISGWKAYFGTTDTPGSLVDRDGQRYQNTAGVTQLLRDGRDWLNALPGVELAAAGFWLPIDVEDGTGFQIVGRPVEKGCCGSQWMSITPGYLSLFRIPVLRGRDFMENDIADAPHVALINEAFARKYWPNEDSIGQQIKDGDEGGLNRSSVSSLTPTTAVWLSLPTP